MPNYYTMKIPFNYGVANSINNRKLMEMKNTGWFLTEVPVERVSGFTFNDNPEFAEFQKSHDNSPSVLISPVSPTRRAKSNLVSMYNNPKIKKPATSIVSRRKNDL